MHERWVVTVWSHRSEASYMFVLEGEPAMTAFCEKVDASGTHEVSDVSTGNDADLWGTGLELG